MAKPNIVCKALPHDHRNPNIDHDAPKVEFAHGGGVIDASCFVVGIAYIVACGEWKIAKITSPDALYDAYKDAERYLIGQAYSALLGGPALATLDSSLLADVAMLVAALLPSLPLVTAGETSKRLTEIFASLAAQAKQPEAPELVYVSIRHPTCQLRWS